MNQGNALQDCADDWMSRDLQTVTPKQSVFEAVQLMAQKNIGSVLVLSKARKTMFGKKGGELQGILTDTDVVRKVVARNEHAENLLVEQIMTPNPRTVPFNYPMVEVARFFLDNKIKRLPVMKKDQLAGVITITDLMYAMAKLGRYYDLGKLFRSLAHQETKEDKMDAVLKISSWMSKPVITVQKRTPVLAVAQLMEYHKLGALPVITPQGYLAGMVTDTDLVKRLVAKKLSAETTLVDDIMTKEVITVKPDQTLKEAAALLVKHRVRRIPVVERDVLVGMASITDIVAMLLQINNVSRATNLIKMLYQGSADYFS